MIRIKNLTKDFGDSRGVFDLSFQVQNGETFALLAPDGSGKTTVLRLLMGFLRPTNGRCYIEGKNCSRQAKQVRSFTGYLPQKSTLPARMTGVGFLRFLAQMRGVRSLEHALKITEHFEVDADRDIRKMTQSERQILSIACAFLHDPAVLLLDEPLSGFVGPAQGRFVDWILEEKRRGKTILICCNAFDGTEAVCDRVGMMQKGMLAQVNDIEEIRSMARKKFRVSFAGEQEAIRFVRSESFEVLLLNGAQITLALSGSLKPLFQVLSRYEVAKFESTEQSLEEMFSYLYGGDHRD